MSTMEAVVVIVALIMFARVLRERIRSDRHTEIPFGLVDPDTLTRENEALRRDLAALADRVKVLERIATDNRHGTDLAAEIEALRDR